MKRLLMITLLAGTVLGIAAPAQAHDGCGHNWHRGIYGNCRPDYGVDYIAVGPNYATAVVPAAEPYVVQENGFWDGDRHYMHREFWNGAGRYG